MAKTIMVDIDNTIADYTNGLRDYIRECGRGEDECPCPEPTAYDFHADRRMAVQRGSESVHVVAYARRRRRLVLQRRTV